jgi:Ca2+/Na+ antiporter
VTHEAFYATAAGVIPLFLILLVFQTREYRVGAVEGWRRPFYAVLFGADIVFAGVAEVVAMFALFRLQDRTWERDVVFLAVAGLTVVVVIAGLKASVARRKSS